jgi:hypothetical protein
MEDRMEGCDNLFEELKKVAESIVGEKNKELLK